MTWLSLDLRYLLQQQEVYKEAVIHQWARIIRPASIQKEHQKTNSIPISYPPSSNISPRSPADFVKHLFQNASIKLLCPKGSQSLPKPRPKLPAPMSKLLLAASIKPRLRVQARRPPGWPQAKASHSSKPPPVMVGACGATKCCNDWAELGSRYSSRYSSIASAVVLFDVAQYGNAN
jgi:hypothetical protein